MIPHIIHQIWFQGKDNLPKKYFEWQKSWKQKHSQWEYILWDEKYMLLELQKSDYAWFYSTWISYPKIIHKIDAFKWILLHAYGGYYVDMDMECIRPLDDLIPGNCEMAIGNFNPYFSFWAKLGGKKLTTNNAFIACIKGHPIAMEWLRFAETVLSNYSSESAKIAEVAIITGPQMVSMFIDKMKSKYEITKIDYKLVEAYPSSKRIKDGYIIHHSDMTWMDQKNFISFLTRVSHNHVAAVNGFIIIIVVVFILIALLVAVIIIIKLKKDKCLHRR